MRLLSLVFVGGMLAVGCGTGTGLTPDGGTTEGGTSTCDSTKCKAGNTCVVGFDTYADQKAGTNATNKCRLTCANQTECPFNYHCFDPQDGVASPYCVSDRATITQGKGQWGTLCDPQKGWDANTDCDTAQGFKCYGISPVDGHAYCTRYDCTDDGDCAGGYWCARLDGTPNVTTYNRTYGASGVVKVCVPRIWNNDLNTHCAPCKADVDCPPNNGGKQHCVTINDASGEKACAAECASVNNCTLDSACSPTTETPEQNVCIPSAGMCVSNGEFCSPCHSDADCKGDGYCVRGDYTSERFCTSKSGIACTSTTKDCPAKPALAYGVGCISSATGDVPKDQCVGVVKFKTYQLLGCWTRARY